MKKRWISWLLVLTMVAALVPQMAIEARAVQSGTCGDNLTWVLDDEGTLTISGTGAMTNYKYNSPWEYNHSIRSVIIEYGVTSIGDDAFRSCDSLTSVTIPNSVTYIGEDAFANCDNLTSVTIPDSVTSIGFWAFNSCEKMTGIWVDAENQFYSSDGAGVLFDKDQKKLIQAPGAISGAYVIPGSVTSIGGDAFLYCGSLTSVTIPDSVTYIGDNAFRSCEKLTSVTISNSVTDIGFEAFGYCDNLTSVMIPASVTYISSSAFCSCDKLTGIWVDADNQFYSSDAAGVLFNKDRSKLIQAPGAISGAYVIPSSVTSINNEAFESCNSLTSVTIPNGVTAIGYYTFAWCDSLTSVTISNGVTSIGDGAFKSCDSLTGVTIPDSVTSIGDDAFWYCGGLTSVTIPDSVISIGDEAFWACDNLTSVTISDSVTFIGDGAFSDCSALMGIWVDANNPSYSSDDAGVLFNKERTKLIQAPGAISGAYVIPNSVTSIGEGAFDSCLDLTNVTIPNSVTTIPDDAFSWCCNLTSVTIPRSVTSIGDYAFDCCFGLTNVTIPSSVTSIGENAFANCESLTDVYYAGNATQWNAIDIGTGNECLTDVTIHFGTSAPDDPTFTLPQDGDYVLIYAPQYNVALSSLKTGYYNQGRTLTADDGTYTGYYKSEIWQVHITSDGSYEFFQNGKSLGMSADYSHLDLGPNNWWKLTDIGNGRYTLRNTRTGKYLEWVPNSEIWYANHSNYSNTNQQMQLAFHVLDDSDSKINGFDPILDGWCLINTEASFGYEDPYYIPIGRYYEVDVNFSSIANSIFGRKWGGSCFGMSLLAAAQYNGDIDLSSYFDKSGEYLNDFGYDDIVDSTLTKNGEVRYDGDIYSVAGNEDIIAMIERAQVSQYSSEIQDIEVFKNDGADYSEVLAHLNQDHPTPLLISIDLGDLGGHAVVTDTSHKPIPLGNGVYAILLYDSTYPQIINNLQHGWSLYQHRQSYLQIDTKNGHFWYYHNGETDGWQVYKDWTGRKIWFYDVSRLKPGFFTNKLRFSTTHTTASFDASNLIITERGSSKVLFEMKDMDSTLYADDIEYYRYCEGLCEDADTAKGYLLIPDGAYSFTNNDSATVSFISNDCVMSYEVMDDAQVHYSLDDTSVVVKNSNDTELTFTCAIQNVDSTAVISANGILDPGCGASIKVNFDGDVPAISVITDSDPEQMRTSFTVDGEIIQEDFHTVGIINPFTDVPSGTFYYEPVLWALENGITTGATATTFNPNGKCQRAQVVTFLHRAAGNPVSDSSRNPFTDVKSSDFFYKPVLWAVEEGITNGISATSFGSYDVCNRAAFVTFLWRAAGEPEPVSAENPFVDIKPSDFYYKPVLWALENSITNGLDATHFGPNASCNRAQVVTFLHRAQVVTFLHRAYN